MREATVIAVHQLLRKAILPAGTYILAIRILRSLGEEFYRSWSRMANDWEYYDEEDFPEISKEIVILTAIVIVPGNLR
jgi:hypothetical protein